MSAVTIAPRLLCEARNRDDPHARTQRRYPFADFAAEHTRHRVIENGHPCNPAMPMAPTLSTDSTENDHEVCRSSRADDTTPSIAAGAPDLNS